jgi:hypothetical protein
VQAVLHQRLSSASSQNKVQQTYCATQRWAASKNKLVAQIASKAVQKKALDDSAVVQRLNMASVSFGRPEVSKTLSTPSGCSAAVLTPSSVVAAACQSDCSASGSLIPARTNPQRTAPTTAVVGSSLCAVLDAPSSAAPASFPLRSEVELEASGAARDDYFDTQHCITLFNRKKFGFRVHYAFNLRSRWSKISAMRCSSSRCQIRASRQGNCISLRGRASQLSG